MVSSFRRMIYPSSEKRSLTPCALRSQPYGLDVERLQEESTRLGVPTDKGERLAAFANLLAIQEILGQKERAQQENQQVSERLIEAEARCGQAEARYGQAEARYGQAEARYGQAEAKRSEVLERIIVTQDRLHRIESLAKERYIQLVELRGSVNLRDELREVLSDGAAPFVARREGLKQPRPSVLEKWTYIFDEADGTAQKEKTQGLTECLQAADRRINSPQKAAAAMVHIVENLDSRVHRSLPARIVRAIGGIAIEESALLASRDCRLIECVLSWAAKPCCIVAREEVDRLIESHSRGEQAIVSASSGDEGDGKAAFWAPK